MKFVPDEVYPVGEGPAVHSLGLVKWAKKAAKKLLMSAAERRKARAQADREFNDALAFAMANPAVVGLCPDKSPEYTNKSVLSWDSIGKFSKQFVLKVEKAGFDQEKHLFAGNQAALEKMFEGDKHIAQWLYGRAQRCAVEHCFSLLNTEVRHRQSLSRVPIYSLDYSEMALRVARELNADHKDKPCGNKERAPYGYSRFFNDDSSPVGGPLAVVRDSRLLEAIEYAQRNPLLVGACPGTSKWTITLLIREKGPESKYIQDLLEIKQAEFDQDTDVTVWNLEQVVAKVGLARGDRADDVFALAFRCAAEACFAWHRTTAHDVLKQSEEEPVSTADMLDYFTSTKQGKERWVECIANFPDAQKQFLVDSTERLTPTQWMRESLALQVAATNPTVIDSCPGVATADEIATKLRAEWKGNPDLAKQTIAYLVAIWQSGFVEWRDLTFGNLAAIIAMFGSSLIGDAQRVYKTAFSCAAELCLDSQGVTLDGVRHQVGLEPEAEVQTSHLLQAVSDLDPEYLDRCRNELPENLRGFLVSPDIFLKAIANGAEPHVRDRAQRVAQVHSGAAIEETVPSWK